jgi:hypothetical protein
LRAFAEPGAVAAWQRIKSKHTPLTSDYPGNMSMWERESLAAEANLAAERKSNKKASTKKAQFHSKVPRSIIPLPP